MNSGLKSILAAGIIAASIGCYDDKLKGENKKETKNLETEIVSSVQPTKVDTVYVEDYSHYSKMVGRKMRIYNEEVGLKGTLEFTLSENGDEYVLTKKRDWQKEVKGKKVSVYDQVDFYSSVEEPRKLKSFESSAVYDKDWLMTNILLERETAGEAKDFKKAEEIYLQCLDALERPTINGRPRVAPIPDGGI
ncbi:hypothetical protein HYV89_05190 [Candidatus Woesearchaeota archaeon]|nr:hypothetical protein [Candidatus Woesearchaeota archaeon]